MTSPHAPHPLVMAVDGAEHHPAAVSSILPELLGALAHLPTSRAGVRLHEIHALAHLLSAEGHIGAIAASVLGRRTRAVRAILFDKTAETNWSLAWHQDRTISVMQHVEVAGFGPWSTKAGMQHVAPPFDLLTRMVTLRAHLDDVPFTNAPLLIAPGSHRAGRVPVEGIADVVRRCGSYTCTAKAGDVWLYATPILHASDAAVNPQRRRVLQIDFAAEELPGGLRWLGV